METDTKYPKNTVSINNTISHPSIHLTNKEPITLPNNIAIQLNPLGLQLNKSLNYDVIIYL